MINGEAKLKLRKHDSFGRVIFKEKEMLYAHKRLTKKESDKHMGLKEIIYNHFIKKDEKHSKKKTVPQTQSLTNNIY